MTINLNTEFNKLVAMLHEHNIPCEVVAYAYTDNRPVLQVCSPSFEDNKVDAITLNKSLEVMSEFRPDVSSPLTAEEAFQIFIEDLGDKL